MIRFRARIRIIESPKYGMPRGIRYNDQFWCSFNTGNKGTDLIMCSIIYLDNDEVMQQSKWYDGVVELPYGDKYPPHCKEFNKDYKEAIDLGLTYHLNYADDIIGSCRFTEVLDLIHNDFDIKRDKNGSYIVKRYDSSND